MKLVRFDPIETSDPSETWQQNILTEHLMTK